MLLLEGLSRDQLKAIFARLHAAGAGGLLKSPAIKKMLDMMAQRAKSQGKSSKDIVDKFKNSKKTEVVQLKMAVQGLASKAVARAVKDIGAAGFNPHKPGHIQAIEAVVKALTDFGSVSSVGEHTQTIKSAVEAATKLGININGTPRAAPLALSAETQKRWVKNAQYLLKLVKPTTELAKEALQHELDKRDVTSKAAELDKMLGFAPKAAPMAPLVTAPKKGSGGFTVELQAELLAAGWVGFTINVLDTKDAGAYELEVQGPDGVAVGVSVSSVGPDGDRSYTITGFGEHGTYHTLEGVLSAASLHGLMNPPAQKTRYPDGVQAVEDEYGVLTVTKNGAKLDIAGMVSNDATGQMEYGYKGKTYKSQADAVRAIVAHAAGGKKTPEPAKVSELDVPFYHSALGAAGLLGSDEANHLGYNIGTTGKEPNVHTDYTFVGKDFGVPVPVHTVTADDYFEVHVGGKLIGKVNIIEEPVDGTNTYQYDGDSYPTRAKAVAALVNDHLHGKTGYTAPSAIARPKTKAPKMGLFPTKTVADQGYDVLPADSGNAYTFVRKGKGEDVHVTFTMESRKVVGSKHGDETMAVHISVGSGPIYVGSVTVYEDEDSGAITYIPVDMDGNPSSDLAEKFPGAAGAHLVNSYLIDHPSILDTDDDEVAPSPVVAKARAKVAELVKASKPEKKYMLAPHPDVKDIAFDLADYGYKAKFIQGPFADKMWHFDVFSPDGKTIVGSIKATDASGQWAFYPENVDVNKTEPLDIQGVVDGIIAAQKPSAPTPIRPKKKLPDAPTAPSKGKDLVLTSELTKTFPTGTVTGSHKVGMYEIWKGERFLGWLDYNDPNKAIVTLHYQPKLGGITTYQVEGGAMDAGAFLAKLPEFSTGAAKPGSLARSLAMPPGLKNLTPQLQIALKAYIASLQAAGASAEVIKDALWKGKSAELLAIKQENLGLKSKALVRAVKKAGIVGYDPKQTSHKDALVELAASVSALTSGKGGAMAVNDARTSFVLVTGAKLDDPVMLGGEAGLKLLAGVLKLTPSTAFLAKALLGPAKSQEELLAIYHSGEVGGDSKAAAQAKAKKTVAKLLKPGAPEVAVAPTPAITPAVAKARAVVAKLTNPSAPKTSEDVIITAIHEMDPSTISMYMPDDASVEITGEVKPGHKSTVLLPVVGWDHSGGKLLLKVGAEYVVVDHELESDAAIDDAITALSALAHVGTAAHSPGIEELVTGFSGAHDYGTVAPDITMDFGASTGHARLVVWEGGEGEPVLDPGGNYPVSVPFKVRGLGHSIAFIVDDVVVGVAERSSPTSYYKIGPTSFSSGTNVSTLAKEVFTQYLGKIEKVQAASSAVVKKAAAKLPTDLTNKAATYMSLSPASAVHSFTTDGKYLHVEGTDTYGNDAEVMFPVISKDSDTALLDVGDGKYAIAHLPLGGVSIDNLALSIQGAAYKGSPEYHPGLMSLATAVEATKNLTVTSNGIYGKAEAPEATLPFSLVNVKNNTAVKVGTHIIGVYSSIGGSLYVAGNKTVPGLAGVAKQVLLNYIKDVKKLPNGWDLSHETAAPKTPAEPASVEAGISQLSAALGDPPVYTKLSIAKGMETPDYVSYKLTNSETGSHTYVKVSFTPKSDTPVGDKQSVYRDVKLNNGMLIGTMVDSSAMGPSVYHEKLTGQILSDNVQDSVLQLVKNALWSKPAVETPVPKPAVAAKAKAVATKLTKAKQYPWGYNSTLNDQELAIVQMLADNNGGVKSSYLSANHYRVSMKDGSGKALYVDVMLSGDEYTLKVQGQEGAEGMVLGTIKKIPIGPFSAHYKVVGGGKYNNMQAAVRGYFTKMSKTLHADTGGVQILAGEKPAPIAAKTPTLPTDTASFVASLAGVTSFKAETVGGDHFLVNYTSPTAGEISVPVVSVPGTKDNFILTVDSSHPAAGMVLGSMTVDDQGDFEVDGGESHAFLADAVEDIFGLAIDQLPASVAPPSTTVPKAPVAKAHVPNPTNQPQSTLLNDIKTVWTSVDWEYNSGVGSNVVSLVATVSTAPSGFKHKMDVEVKPDGSVVVGPYQVGSGLKLGVIKKDGGQWVNPATGEKGSMQAVVVGVLQALLKGAPAASLANPSTALANALAGGDVGGVKEVKGDSDHYIVTYHTASETPAELHVITSPLDDGALKVSVAPGHPASGTVLGRITQDEYGNMEVIGGILDDYKTTAEAIEDLMRAVTATPIAIVQSTPMSSTAKTDAQQQFLGAMKGWDSVHATLVHGKPGNIVRVKPNNGPAVDLVWSSASQEVVVGAGNKAAGLSMGVLVRKNGEFIALKTGLHYPTLNAAVQAMVVDNVSKLKSGGVPAAVAAPATTATFKVEPKTSAQTSFLLSMNNWTDLFASQTAMNVGNEVTVKAETAGGGSATFKAIHSPITGDVVVSGAVPAADLKLGVLHKVKTATITTYTNPFTGEVFHTLPTAVQELVKGLVKEVKSGVTAAVAAPMSPHPASSAPASTLTSEMSGSSTPPTTYQKGIAPPEPMHGVSFDSIKGKVGVEGSKQATAYFKAKPNVLLADEPVEPVKAAGVLMLEPDGRVWIRKVAGNYGGYEYSFAKGTRSDTTMSMQQAAHMEVYEETGMEAEITGYLGDYLGTSTSKTRFYIGRRIAGNPGDAGKETDFMQLVTLDEALGYLNQERDKKIIGELKGYVAKLASPQGALKMVEGQKGSNKGGLYRDSVGSRWYIKHYANPAQGKAELAAASIYRMFGLEAPHVVEHTMDGKPALASRWVDGLKPSTGAQLKAIPAEERAKILVASALIANYDVVGLSNDNMLMGPGGKIHLIDQGGSFDFRAQGKSKPFGSEATEIDTLRDSKVNAAAAAVFGDIKDDQIKQALRSLASMDPDKLHNIAKKSGLSDELANSLMDRRAYLLKRFGVEDPIAIHKANLKAMLTKAPATVLKAQLKGAAKHLVKTAKSTTYQTPKPKHLVGKGSVLEGHSEFMAQVNDVAKQVQSITTNPTLLKGFVEKINAPMAQKMAAGMSYASAAKSLGSSFRHDNSSVFWSVAKSIDPYAAKLADTWLSSWTGNPDASDAMAMKRTLAHITNGTFVKGNINAKTHASESELKALALLYAMTQSWFAMQFPGKSSEHLYRGIHGAQAKTIKQTMTASTAVLNAPAAFHSVSGWSTNSSTAKDFAGGSGVYFETDADYRNVLIWRDFLPTHNSFFGSSEQEWWVMSPPKNVPMPGVLAHSKDGTYGSKAY